MEALPFRVSAEEREAAFKAWVRNHTPLLFTPTPTSASSWYLPFWAFDCSVQVAVAGRTYYRETHTADMQVYAGHTFRRSMLEVAKNDLADAVPFSADLLDIGQAPVLGDPLKSTVPAQVDIDSWEVFEATALARVRAAVSAHEAEVLGPVHPGAPIRTTLHDITSRRVLMPVHVVQYSHWGVEYRVFINGVTGQAFGLQDTASLFGPSVAAAVRRIKNIHWAVPTSGVAATIMAPGMLKPALVIAATALRLLLLPPVMAAGLLSFAVYQATFIGRALHRKQSSMQEWVEERATERAMQAAMSDEWVFRSAGRARRDNATSRSDQHADSAARAKAQARAQAKAQADAKAKADRAAREAAAAAERAQQRKRAQAQAAAEAAAKAKATRKPPPVDVTDYYAVLGLDLGPAASTAEVQKAFRREMMLYHPDHNLNTGMDLAAASARTQAILQAYKTLRDPKKRAAYDAGYTPSSKRRR